MDQHRDTRQQLRNAPMQGRIVLSKWMTRKCVVRELDPGEARLELASFITAPSTFTLLISGKPVSVRLAWQQGCRVGVTVEPEPAALA